MAYRYNATGNLSLNNDTSTLHQVVQADGWNAVYAPCPGCGTDIRVAPVAVWAAYRWPDKGHEIVGMVSEPGIGLAPAPSMGHFVGYLPYGTDPMQLIEDAMAELEGLDDDVED